MGRNTMRVAARQHVAQRAERSKKLIGEYLTSIPHPRERRRCYKCKKLEDKHHLHNTCRFFMSMTREQQAEFEGEYHELMREAKRYADFVLRDDS